MKLSLKCTQNLNKSLNLLVRIRVKPRAGKTPCHSRNMIGMQAKLPKLVITNVSGSRSEWFAMQSPDRFRCEKLVCVSPVNRFTESKTCRGRDEEYRHAFSI